MTPADRMSIQALLQAKLNGPAIARRLGFSRSAINREINRSKALPTALAAHYQAGVAQARSEQRRRDAGACRRKLGPDTQSPLPRWPVQIPPPVATSNSPRQGPRDYVGSVVMARRLAASLRR